MMLAWLRGLFTADPIVTLGRISVEFGSVSKRPAPSPDAEWQRSDLEPGRPVRFVIAPRKIPSRGPGVEYSALRGVPGLVRPEGFK